MSANLNTPWDVLGVETNASMGEIKRAYTTKLANSSESDKKRYKKAYDYVLSTTKKSTGVPKAVQKPVVTDAHSYVTSTEIKNHFSHEGNKAKPNRTGMRCSNRVIVKGVEHISLNESEQVVTHNDNILFSNPIIEKFYNGPQDVSKRIPGRDITETIKITLDEAFTGIVKHIPYVIETPCDQCVKTCNQCDGCGRVPMYKIMEAGIKQKFNIVCKRCLTRGYMVCPRPDCDKCGGTGFEYDNKTVIWNMHPGIATGEYMMLEGQGEQILQRRCPPGNRIYTVEVEMPTPHYSRVDHHLKIKLPITFIQSVTGAQYEFMVPCGDRLKLNTLTDIATVVHPLVLHRYEGKGMPVWNPVEKCVSHYGDAVVHFDIEYDKLVENPDVNAIKEFKEAYLKLIEVKEET